ncbi:hypothetical protein B0H14DRAFT_2591110 [Mycena olivaceomarginata]|nr:hypothetical protein B0H14DRAFT_2591110 [Mycena olivaceomarginata]
MLPDLQLICHPPSNGGVVWRIDACATRRVAVFSAYATILEFAQLLVKLVYHARRLQLIQLGVIQYGVVSSLSEWVGAFVCSPINPINRSSPPPRWLPLPLGLRHALSLLQEPLISLRTASPTYSSVLYTWGWKFGFTAPDSAARLPAAPGFLCTFAGLPFGPHPLLGAAPFPIATQTSPPTIPLPLLTVPRPLDRCSAAPAHRPPHTACYSVRCTAAPCAPPAPPPLVTPPYPLAAPTAPLVAPGHHSACVAPARDSASSAEPASCSATPPHHCPNAVLPLLPAASACLSPASPIIFPTESIPPSSLPEVRPFRITRTAGPLLLSFLPPPPSASRHRCPYSRRLVRAFRELLTGGGCADKVSVCSLYRQTASTSDAARLLGGKWSGGRPERGEASRTEPRLALQSARQRASAMRSSRHMAPACPRGFRAVELRLEARI